MRSSLAVILAFILVLSAAAAFASSQPVGGVATAQPGKVDLSAGYFYSKDKWDSNTVDGNATIKTNMYYGQLGYGVAPGWDVYLRAGATESKGEGDLDLKSNAKFFASVGFHGRLFEYKPWNLAFGPVGNLAFYENYSERSSAMVGGAQASGTLGLKDHYSADIGFGFQWKPIKGWTIFGGPFYHYDTAKLEYSYSRGGRYFSDSDNVHTKKPFGPRLGLNIMLTNDLYLQIEGQSREYVSGGASIGLNF
jgi:hypothetical protein